ncbi:MAG: carboxylate--amine ligase, partial [Eggerthellaceae bacterium]|nr:carboxylate--amine ligase [Eggerthellaceae bacterium]
MPQNADYTQEYFEILEGFDGDIAGRRAARAYMLASTAICHDEVVDSSFIPRLYSHETYLAFKNTAETIHRILCKVIEHYLQDPLYRSIFSFDERLVELILLPRGYPSLLPFARVDVFLDEDDLRVAFCEFNADGSSGMNEDREILASIAPSRSFKEFSRRHHVASSELFASWVDEFIRIYESYEFRVEKPRVAICDFLENAIIDEFHIYAGFFEARGIPCSIVDVRELRFDGQALRGPDGTAIDAIWRRSVTNDIIDHWDQSQELINALRARKVALIGSFAGHIVHDKQIFRALSNPLTQAFLTPEEISFL